MRTVREFEKVWVGTTSPREIITATDRHLCFANDYRIEYRASIDENTVLLLDYLYYRLGEIERIE